MGLLYNAVYKTLQGGSDLMYLSTIKNSSKSENERRYALSNLESEWALKEAWNYFDHQDNDVMYSFVAQYCCPLIVEWKERGIEQNIMELALKFDGEKFFFDYHTRHRAIFQFTERIFDWSDKKVYRKFTFEEEKIIYRVLSNYSEIDTSKLSGEEVKLVNWAKTFRDRVYKHLNRF